MKKIIIIKNKLDSNKSEHNKEIEKYAHESFCNGEERTYHAGANDSKSLSTLYEEEMFIMLISYHEQGHHGGDSPDDCQIDRIYIGEAIIKKQISNMEKVDIVYIDPPYKTDLAYKSIDLMIKKDLLNDESLIIIETDQETEILKKINELNINFLTKKCQ